MRTHARFVTCTLLSSGSGSLSAPCLLPKPSERGCLPGSHGPAPDFCLGFSRLPVGGILLVGLAQEGALARAATRERCTAPLAHTLVVFTFCLGVGAGGCHCFMFLLLCFLAERTGCLCLFVSAHFSVATCISSPLTASGVPPFLCSHGSLPGPVPITSGLRCLVTYWTSPLARQTSISDFPIRP